MKPSCIDPETLAMFAEGTLPADEIQAVRAHLTGCDRCLRALRGVNETLHEEREAPRRPWLAIAAMLAVIVGAGALAAVWLAARAKPAVSRLVELSPRDARPLEPRLTGGFAWAAYAGPVRASGNAPDAARMKLVGAAGDLVERAERDPSPAAQHAAGVALALTGDALSAVTRLRAVVQSAPGANAWSDLAAAQAAAALALARPSLYPEALASADRALQLEPRHPEALFNRAVILERLGVAAEARAAWQRYLEVDSSSPWAQEARERLHRLPPATAESLFRGELPRLERAAATNDETTVRELVLRYPQHARTWGEAEYLGLWGEAMLRGDAAEARRLLLVARGIGKTLEATSGETLLAGSVASVERGDAATLARAHATYRRARIAYSRQRPAEAEPELRDAAALFAAAGSPMALVARYYAANTRYDQNDVTGARVELVPLLAEAEARNGFLALGAQLRWELALCDAADADWNAALASLTTAADAFRRLGERSNLAFIETLLAQALTGLGRLDDAWAANIRSFAALAEEGRGDRLPVSLNSAAACELSAGRRDTALALLRLAESAVRATDNDALLAHVLMQQTLLATELGERGAAREMLAELAAAAERLADGPLREKARNEARFAQAALVLPSQPRDAADLLTRAIGFYTASDKPALLPECHLLRARARLREGDRDGAAEDLRSGIALLDAQRVELARGVAGTGVLDAGTALYAEAIRLEVDRGDAAAAFALAERRRGVAAPDAALLQRRLSGSGTAVLELVALPEEVIALTVTADRIGISRRETRAGPLPSAPDELYDLLIRPAERYIGDARHLIVVADPKLSQVPFAALYDRSARRYLIESRSVALAADASSLVVAAGGCARRDCRALGMMLPSGEASGSSALPESAAELADLRSLYAHFATPPAATFGAFRTSVRGADVIHLSGHTERQGGGETALVFADGRVPWRTIAGTAMGNGVVVLAACETLSASTAPYERSLSLGAAFAAAGATDVIGTLTPIADADARSLFRSIHRELAAGVDPVEAVRRSQLEALRAPRNGRSPAWPSIAMLTRRIPAGS